ncbi:MAG: four helix bundle protein [Bacteroidales bacterium]|nr:four helix bundle protein [Bacteroidales bacterium]
MNNFYDALAARLMNFAVKVIQLDKELNKTYTARHAFSQVFPAATSAGANYEEARAGEIRADFVHKMQIVHKELRESRYWLQLIYLSAILPSKFKELIELQNEVGELIRIIAKSILTAKSGGRERDKSAK